MKLRNIIIPLLTFVLALLLWEYIVNAYAIPPYILPAPSLIAQTLVADWSILAPALGVTLMITLLALVLAVMWGVGFALLFASAKWIEHAFMPFAIFLQVTPIIAIAPLILIYMPDMLSAMLLIAFIVAFFPILSNTAFGLNSTDHNLRDLFKLYGAGKLQTLFLLQLPFAQPAFLNGLKIASGLALIGAVVAEFAAGSVGLGAGLAFRLMEASYRLNIPRVFAALALITFSGLVLYLIFSALSYFMLRRWHESEIRN
jgi:NitT/TauT family transport system permease protein